MDGDGLGYDLVESVCLLWLVFVVLNVTVVVLTFWVFWFACRSLVFEL